MARSREVGAAVGEAAERSLEERAAALRRTIEQPSPKERAVAELREIEAQIAAQKEETAKAAAEERVVGISRAAGGLVATLEADEKKLLDAAKAYAAALDIVNSRYKQIEKLRDENAALVDRFGIEGAKIPTLAEPQARVAVVAAGKMIPAPAQMTARRPSMEQCEHGLRERRDYAEIAGTEAYRIIQSAGLRPFRPLSPSEQRAVEAVVDVGEQEMLRREAIAATAPQRSFADRVIG